MPKDKIIIIFFSLSLIALIVAAGMVLLFLPVGNVQLVLHFDPQHNISLLGGKYIALFGIGLFFLVGVINFIILREIYYRERFLSYLVAFMTLVVSLLCLIAAGVTVAVN